MAQWATGERRFHNVKNKTGSQQIWTVRNKKNFEQIVSRQRPTITLLHHNNNYSLFFSIHCSTTLFLHQSARAVQLTLQLRSPNDRPSVCFDDRSWVGMGRATVMVSFDLSPPVCCCESPLPVWSGCNSLQWILNSLFPDHTTVSLRTRVTLSSICSVGLILTFPNQWRTQAYAAPNRGWC